LLATIYHIGFGKVWDSSYLYLYVNYDNEDAGLATDDDPLDRLAKKARTHSKPAKVARSNRTHALKEPEYTVLRNYCLSKGLRIQEVLDELIAAFLEKIKDDLSPDLPPKE
jgi:hypothetical protein